VFARKILRLVGSVTAKQIDEEVRIMTDLCKGECRFVVKVLEHDWLEHESLYFIDMEFCSQNLHDYIRQSSTNLVRQRPEDKAPSFKAPAKIPEMIESQLEFVHPYTPLDRPRAMAQPLAPNTPTDQPANQMACDIAWEPIGTIIDNIVSGLKYIHGKKVVHRDLKPQNGTALSSVVFLTSI
jgi:serine/threonine protein kinase